MEPVGVQGPRPRAKAHRPVQPQIQQHAPPPRRRILPDHARHRPRRRPASASEGRGGPRPAQRRGHPHRPRRRSRQDVRGRRPLPRGETPRQGVQADARGPQPPRGPVGRRRAQALPGRPDPRHGQGRATQSRIGAPVLGTGRHRRLGRGDRAGKPVQPAARQQGTPAAQHARPSRRVRPGRRGRRQGQGRQGPDRQTAGGGAQKRRDRHEQAARRQGVARRQGAGGHRVRIAGRGHAHRRRGPPLQEPRRARRIRGPGHAIVVRREMRGPARQMRMAARGRARRQHRVHDRNAGIQLHERAVQHAALPRARNPQGAGSGHVRRMGGHLRPGRAHRGTETRRQRLPGQAKVRAVPEPARTDERGEAVHRHDHQRRHPAATARTGAGARPSAHHRPAEGGDGGTVRQGGPRARRRRAA